MDEGKLSRAESKQRTIDDLKNLLGGSDSSSGDSPSAVKQADLPKEEKTGETVKGSKRRDPRDNSKMKKVLIPNPVPGGKDVWIDVNLKTGGIFLDRGELSELSAMPDPVTILRAAIRTASASL